MQSFTILRDERVVGGGEVDEPVPVGAAASPAVAPQEQRGGVQRGGHHGGSPVGDEVGLLDHLHVPRRGEHRVRGDESGEVGAVGVGRLRVQVEHVAVPRVVQRQQAAPHHPGVPGGPGDDVGEAREGRGGRGRRAGERGLDEERGQRGARRGGAGRGGEEEAGGGGGGGGELERRGGGQQEQQREEAAGGHGEQPAEVHGVGARARGGGLHGERGWRLEQGGSGSWDRRSRQGGAVLFMGSSCYC